MNPRPPFLLRPVEPGDAEALVNLVRELAVDEQLEAHARATPDDFRAHLFGPARAAEAIVAEVLGEVVGFALFYTTFSSFRGCPGLYLEDIFVQPAHRGLGIGKGLLASVARQAVERGYPKIDWSVLDWNAPSIAFYRAAGAWSMDEWTVYRLDAEPLARLAALAPDLQGTTKG